jgi:hemolysin D
MLDERVARRKELAAQGLSSKLLQLELEQQQEAHRRDIGVQGDSAARYQASASSVRSQMTELNQTFAKEAATLLAKAEDEIALREEELTKAAQKSQLQQLKSPVAGTVQQMSIHTLGAIVKPADPLLVVVPSDGLLVVEAQVLNKDVGQLKIGQDVAVKLEAFPFTRYGTIAGTLIGLSQDAIQDEKLGLVYQARVQLRCGRTNSATAADKIHATKPQSATTGRTAMTGHNKDKPNSLLCAHVAPGMVSTVDIRTGSRSMMEFLLSPLARRAQEAGREM